jgi:hypothetical protein
VTTDRDDLLFLYLAGAVDPSEREEVEEWIAGGSPEAFEHLARAASDLAALAAAQPRHEAPAPVRQRLLARIAAERGAQVHAAPARRWLPLALAAGLAGLLAVGVGFGASRMATRKAEAREAALRTELDAARADVAKVAGERDELDGDLADTEARLRSLESDLVLSQKTIGVLRAEHAEAVALSGTALAQAAHGRVFWDWDAWYCYLHVTGLQQDPSKTYAIWLYTEDDVVGVGTFHSNADGVATFLGPVPHVGHVLRAAVSVEPDEDLGSKPRGDVVMLGEAKPAKS